MLLDNYLNYNLFIKLFLSCPFSLRQIVLVLICKGVCLSVLL